MSLLEHRSEGLIRILWVRDDAIGLESGDQTRSFLLTPQRVVSDWGPTSAAEVDETAIQTVLVLEPDIVLLGTGSRQVFPSQSVLASFLQRGVGIEVMNNAAAARTFALLSEEGRQVVAAFILPVAAEA